MFLRSGHIFKMSIYQPFALPFVMSQLGLWLNYIHFQVLILTSSLSEKGEESYWRAFSNAGDSIQEAFCHLGSMPLESTVTDALELYICHQYCLTHYVEVVDGLERKEVELQKLPLPRAVFLVEVKHAQYQCNLWKTSSVINPDKSMPDNNG